MAELRFLVRTPRAVAIDRRLQSVRLPTESGQFGLRPGAEPMLVAIEPGLLLLRDVARTDYAASAGGLLSVAREVSTLYTPFAVSGGSAEEVLEQFEQAQQDPTSDLSTHRQLEALELKILRELRREDRPASGLGRSR
jgi:F0F1-type ATP synthase epsilon subunit